MDEGVSIIIAINFFIVRYKKSAIRQTLNRLVRAICEVPGQNLMFKTSRGRASEQTRRDGIRICNLSIAVV